MKCKTSKQGVDRWLGSGEELGSEENLHLSQCSLCRLWFERSEAVHAFMQEASFPPPPSPEAQKLAVLDGVERADDRRTSSDDTRSGFGFGLFRLASGVAFMLALVVGLCLGTLDQDNHQGETFRSEAKAAPGPGEDWASVFDLLPDDYGAGLLDEATDRSGS